MMMITSKGTCLFVSLHQDTVTIYKITLMSQFINIRITEIQVDTNRYS